MKTLIDDTDKRAEELKSKAKEARGKTLSAEEKKEEENPCEDPLRHVRGEITRIADDETIAGEQGHPHRIT